MKDGFDYDADGLCDAGDTDDDNDGALDENDSSDNDPLVCSDSDEIVVMTVRLELII